MFEQEIADRLALASRLVAEGYGIAADIQERGFDVTWKMIGEGRSNPVTDADRAVEEHLYEAINANFPHDIIIGEENGVRGASGDPDERFVWVNDPVDGTTNFSRRLSPWGVSMAVLHGGIPVVAAVAVEETVYATSRDAAGVIRNDTKVLTRTPGSVRGKKGYLACESLDALRGGSHLMEQLWRKGYVTRGLGSAVGQCVYVLEGRLDAFIHPRLSIFDHAAVSLLLEKGGGQLVRWDGTRPFPAMWKRVCSRFVSYVGHPYQYDLLAAFPDTYDDLLTTVIPWAGECELL